MEKQFSNRAKSVSGSAIREIFKLLQNPEIISFAGGMPAKETFPVKTMQKLTTQVFEKDGINILQYGQTSGYMPLRKTIIDQLKSDNIEVSLDELLITTGAQQGIDLTVKAFINPGDVVLVESPTFLGALQIFQMYGAKTVAVDTDENGIVISDLIKKINEHTPKLLYVIPTFQNPTGVTTSASVREQIALLASKHNFMVLEDDPYGKLRYQGQAIPPIRSFDKTGNVITLYSFSKVISPGLRVGYAIGDKEVIAKLTIGKQSTDVHTSNLSQAIINEFIVQGYLAPHIDLLKKDYKIRMDCMQQMIKEHFPKDIQVTSPEGGLFIWAELPNNIDTKELLKTAVTKNVAYIPGESFYCENPKKNTMRLNFSASNPEKIKQGIIALGSVLNQL